MKTIVTEIWDAAGKHARKITYQNIFITIAVIVGAYFGYLTAALIILIVAHVLISALYVVLSALVNAQADCIRELHKLTDQQQSLLNKQ